jgi:uncharacterized protein (TIGR00255 family)
MTIHSMTGYASVVSRGAGPEAIEASVEARSVNGRFLDLSLKLPDELRALEPALRERVGATLRRGKVELRVSLRSTATSSGALPSPGDERLRQLERLQAAVRACLPDAQPLSVHEALQWCREPGGELPAEDTVLDAAAQCLNALGRARAREGDKLKAMLLERIAALRDAAARAAPLIPAVVQRQQARFLERWQEALQGADIATDATRPTGAPPGAGAVATLGALTPQALQERSLQEAATYAIRIDVAEELSRLGAHLDEIERLLARGGEVGKRLDFLIQELHREANTLGSKSAALELTALSVEMKVLIEQMREQVQNIE